MLVKFLTLLLSCFYLGSSAYAIKRRPGAKQGESCKTVRCEKGLTCLKYFGIGGRAGGEFATCEIPCGDAGKSCPEGQECKTVVDGPGKVCVRPFKIQQPRN
jgi:hypothetical protein